MAVQTRNSSRSPHPQRRSASGANTRTLADLPSALGARVHSLDPLRTQTRTPAEATTQPASKHARHRRQKPKRNQHARNQGMGSTGHRCPLEISDGARAAQAPFGLLGPSSVLPCVPREKATRQGRLWAALWAVVGCSISTRTPKASYIETDAHVLSFPCS